MKYYTCLHKLTNYAVDFISYPRGVKLEKYCYFNAPQIPLCFVDCTPIQSSLLFIVVVLLKVKNGLNAANERVELISKQLLREFSVTVLGYMSFVNVGAIHERWDVLWDVIVWLFVVLHLVFFFLLSLFRWWYWPATTSLQRKHLRKSLSRCSQNLPEAVRVSQPCT